MHAVVVAGSRLERSLDPAEFLDADLVIAADSGADALLSVGFVPGLLVGDMDSLRPESHRELERRGVEVVLLSTEKDETDLEMALRAAVERGATRVTVHAALGGPRLDHLIATLLLLTAPWLRGAHVRLVDPWHEVRLVGGATFIEGAAGQTVSLLPLTPVVESVTTEGLRYPLRDEALLQGTTRGVSNEMTGGRASVRHGDGVLLLIHYRGETEPHVQFEPDGR